MKSGLRLLLALPAVTALLAACTTRQYDACPPDRQFGLWGVINKSNDFGCYDSIYFVVNPIGVINDSLYFNANYTDSYYRADSTRISFACGRSDTMFFFFDRMYSVQVNPEDMIMKVRVDGDTAKAPSHTLFLKRTGDSEKLYGARYDSTFINLLRLEKPLHILATNGPTSSNPEGSQNYVYTLYGAGFNRAMALCDSLNGKPLKPDTVKAKDEKKHPDKKEEKWKFRL